ncbi:MAG TPA: FtsX-like permease family protein [Myxococcota bacterium]|nr:FtsX-like permease family protein [Myxococcota bacterium]HRY96477.1 FtsX-like permease family protein [Myxococcota bacterium]HSA22913.1 FtsX-like permease family protein [Myxococcota bacterium]
MAGLRIAWRNLWRNGRRTGITAAAIALNTAVLIVSFGLMHGIVVDMVRQITTISVGDAQVHAQGFRAARSFYKAIPPAALDALLAQATTAGVLAAPRSFGFGLVSSGPKSAGAMFWGVDPVAERRAFGLPGRIARGQFLADRVEGRSYLGRPVREIVLGRKLAKTLHAEVGSELVAVVQAGDGSLGNELFTVTGVLAGVGEEIDRAGALVHRQDFDELFVAQGRVHELALSSRGALPAEEVAARLGPISAGLELQTWGELLPAIADMVRMFDGVMWLFALVFLLAAGLGVTNTMLMATYERMREFGVLKALGASPWRILGGVTGEALLLGMLASLAGSCLGLAGTWYLTRVGIDLSGGGDLVVQGMAMQSVWRASLTPADVILPVLAMWLACVLAALYPAAKAARIDPVRAMTHV